MGPDGDSEPAAGAHACGDGSCLGARTQPDLPVNPPQKLHRADAEEGATGRVALWCCRLGVSPVPSARQITRALREQPEDHEAFLLALYAVISESGKVPVPGDPPAPKLSKLQGVYGSGGRSESGKFIARSGVQTIRHRDGVRVHSERAVAAVRARAPAPAQHHQQARGAVRTAGEETTLPARQPRR